MISCERVRRWREKNVNKYEEYQLTYKKNNLKKYRAYNQKNRDKKKKKLIEEAFERQRLAVMKKEETRIEKRLKYKEIFSY